MTMIDPTPTTASHPEPSEMDKFKDKIDSLESTIHQQNSMLIKWRNKQRDLYQALNEYISEEEKDENDSIKLSELDDILQMVFDERLEFLKTFDVEMEWTVRASITIKAADADAARSIAEDISFDEPELDIDEDTTEIDSIDIDAEGVRSCRQQ